MAVEGTTLYDSDASNDGSDGKSKTVIAKNGAPLVIQSAIIKLMAIGATQEGRTAAGIASIIHEQDGEWALGDIKDVDISDLTLNDPSITDPKVVVMIANHAEAISRQNIKINQLIDQLNLFFVYAHNEGTLTKAANPKK